jgi:hypothetical protein
MTKLLKMKKEEILFKKEYGNFTVYFDDSSKTSSKPSSEPSKTSSKPSSEPSELKFKIP